MDILLIFLPFILFLGLITSYEDIKFGKIRNKYIILGIGISLLLYALVIVYNLITDNPIDYKYFFFLAANTLISLIVAVCLWMSLLWSAADAKLFVAFVTLLPLSIYQYSFNEFFPSILLLINCFVPYFIYLSSKAIFLTDRKDKIKVLRKIKLLELLEMILGLFVSSWVVRFFFIKDILINLVLVTLLYLIFEKVTKAKILNKITVLSALALLRIFVDVKTLVTYNFWLTFSSFTLVFTILRFFMSNLIKRAIIHNLSVKKLKPGILLAEVIEKKKNRYIKSASIDKSVIDISAEGLTTENIKKIKKTGIKKIKIFETIYFAPFIFIGAIITIIARGNLFNLIFIQPSYILPILSNLIIVGVIFLWYINTKKYKKETGTFKLK